jgi:predicted AAA+ superfamily ATPase
VGRLWENFCIAERMKRNDYSRTFAQYYFWRTYDQQEIDFIEEYNGTLSAYEFKWGNAKTTIPKLFLSTYEHSTFLSINKDTVLDFIT